MLLRYSLRTPLFLALFLGFNAKASDTNVDFGIHHQYQGSRPLGMGDAFVAVANDYNALLYNPAGLARREDGEMNLFMDVEAASNFQTFNSDASAASGTTGTDTQKQQAMFDLLQKEYGKAIGVRSTLFAGFLVEPKWGVAIIPADVTIEGTFHQGVGPTLNATVFADTTVAAGYGDDLRGWVPGRLSWGVTGKVINRGYFSKSMNFVELAANSTLVQTSDLHEGLGVDGDVGFLYTPYIPREGFFSLFELARPTFGLVVRNVAQSTFSNSVHWINKSDTTPPQQLYRVVDIGSKWEYPSFWIFGGRGVLDIRDIGHPEFNLHKGLHAGFEFDWAVANWWKGAYRVGYSEGYLTAGVSAMFALFNLDVLTYSEDLGTYSTPVENRMYAIRLNINW